VPFEEFPVLKRFVLCVAAAAFVLPAAQGVAACATPEVIRAAQLRQFHDQLQVAALNCRADDPTMSDKWEAYVGRFGGTLGENARTLQRHFKGAAAFDRYNTQITNAESVRVHHDEADYCEKRSEYFGRVVTMTPDQLHGLAAEAVGKPSHIAACPTKAEKKPAKAKSTEKSEKPAEKKAPAKAPAAKTPDKNG